MKKYVDIEVLKQQDFQDFSNTDVWCAIDNCPIANVVHRDELIKKFKCNRYHKWFITEEVIDYLIDKVYEL